jgi:tetratricopeptide (TPR) repeat protein
MLKKRDGGFISILGEPGIGKKTVLNMALAQLTEKNFCLLQLDCHPSLNTVPFASLQNLIRSMFSLPLINYEAEKNLTIVRNALSQSLGIVSDDVVNPILNLLVPKADDTKDINQAKDELVFATKELFRAISKMQKVVLLAKEIEFLDKSSAEVIDAMIDDGLLKDTFLITTTSNNSHISAFMQSEQIAFNNIGSVKLNPFRQEETLTELAYYIKNTQEIPAVILEQIKEKTQGWPLFLEEIIVFLGQAGFVSIDTDGVNVRPEISELILPDAIEELIAVRIDSLFSQNEVLHQFITNAACLGYAFYPLIIQHVLGLDNESFNKTLQTLVNTGLLHTHDNVNYKFKNKFMYEVIRNIVIKNEEQEKQINLNLLKVIIDMNESNSSQTAHIAKKAQDFQTAFTLWTMAAKEANSTGDKILYLLAQKEALSNIDYSDYPDKEDRKIALQEQLGINNYLSTPEEAISFLAQAISLHEQQNNRKKVIELCGYIVKSLAMLGNIQEATEYIDKTIEYISPEKMPLELALLKFIKLKFLVESGYLGEVVSTIQTEIMPSLQQGIKNQNDFSDKEFEIIKDTVMQSQIILIKALSLQGNKNYYNVLELFVNSGPDEESQIKIFVIDALHNTLNGMPDESNISVEKTENILKGTNIEDKAQIMLELDLIKTANKCLYEQGSNTQEIAMLAQKARNLNNSFVYNCAQILFIKQLFDNKDFANAANIVNDCLNFFASQKIALFAIPCWALLSKIQAQIGSFDQAVSISQQALDVASKPQIQNNYFCAYLKKLLSDFFMEQGDFDMAKMHLEQAIDFSKANDLLFFQGKLYLDLAKLHQKTLENSENQEETKETIIKLVQTASEISTSVESKFLQQQIEKIKEELVIL